MTERHDARTGGSASLADLMTFDLQAFIDAISIYREDAFFSNLTRQLALALDMRCVLVGRVVAADGGDVCETIAVWNGDGHVPNIIYALAGSPCRDVSNRQMCFHPRRIQATFPNDALLVDMEAESYIGTPLVDSQGHTLGILAALDTKPIDDAKRGLALSLLTICATRAVAELLHRDREATLAEMVDKRTRELAESRERFRQLTENTSDWIWEVDRNGVYTYASPKVFDLLGHAPEDVVGKTPFDFMDPEEARRVGPVFADLAGRGEPIVNLLNVNRRRDGTRVTLETSGVPLFDDEGRLAGYRGVDRDVTERQHAEEKLRDVNEKLHQAQRIAHLGSWVWDVASGALDWTDEIFAMFGFDPDTTRPSYETFLARVHPDDVAAVEEAVKDALHRGSYDITHRIVRSDGEIRYIKEKGGAVFDATRTPLIMTGTAQDVTEYTRIQDALRQSEEKYRLLFERSQDPMWVIKGHAFAVCNAAAARILGYDGPADLENMHPAALSPPLQPDGRNSLDKAERMMEDAYRDGYVHFEWLHRRQNGEVFPVDVSLTRIPYENEQALFCVWHDISAQKEAEDVLRRHRDDLERQVQARTRELSEQARELAAALEQEQRYSAMQQKFVSLISHEFRTPLTIIDGSAQRIKRRLGNMDDDELLRRAEKIRIAVDRMVGMMETVLYVSRVDEGKIKFTPRRIDLHALLAAAREMQADISPHHDIRMDIDALPQFIEADEKLLTQVLVNLLSNAVKYSPANTVVEVGGSTDGPNALISVRDHGVGIPERDWPMMFQRFFRASTAEGIPGSGLGLSVCKDFLDLHNGDLAFDSVEGEGTTFLVTLPVKSAPATR
ncbi:MAG: PAS domain S-box protein [Alphaproteobacteria bacterium]|nr:PAS domain S-box protein [Alphaproteobacteria bacterium]